MHGVEARSETRVRTASILLTTVLAAVGGDNRERRDGGLCDGGQHRGSRLESSSSRSMTNSPLALAPGVGSA